MRNPLRHIRLPNHQTTSDVHGAYPYAFPSILLKKYGCSDIGMVHPCRLLMGGSESVHVETSRPYSVTNGFQGVPIQAAMWSEPQHCHGPAPAMAGGRNPHHDVRPPSYEIPDCQRGKWTPGET